MGGVRLAGFAITSTKNKECAARLNKQVVLLDEIMEGFLEEVAVETLSEKGIWKRQR